MMQRGWKMRKYGIALYVVSALLIILLIGIFSIGYLATRPVFEARYFTQPYLEKYSSPELAFNHLWESHILGDKEYYQEVLGRGLSEKESKWAYSDSEKPEIEKVLLHENSAYIVAENNWGGSFEKLNGRWVFQNRETGLYCRELFRFINIELSKFKD